MTQSFLTPDLFSAAPFSQAEIIRLKNAELYYCPSFFSHEESSQYFNTLLKTIQWKQDHIKMYGKIQNLPRLSAWYGDSDKPYSYSGIRLYPKKWTPTLLEIKQRICRPAGRDFSSVLLNRYRDGKDYVGWHSDAEKELGINPVIVSVNFGATRKFQLRRADDHHDKFELELKHGTLLIMLGETQHFWQHQVPKTTIPVGERLNLTFRFIN